MAEGFRQFPPIPLGIQRGTAAPPPAVVGGFTSLLGLWMGGHVAAGTVPTPPGGGSERDWRSSQAWHRSYTT